MANHAVRSTSSVGLWFAAAKALHRRRNPSRSILAVPLGSDVGVRDQVGVEADRRGEGQLEGDLAVVEPVEVPPQLGLQDRLGLLLVRDEEGDE